MRVYPVGLPAVHSRRNVVHANVTRPAPQENQVAFKGLKLGDYIAGAICGTAMAAVGFAVAGPVGAIALGAWGAKTTAEANNDTRKDD